MIATYKIFLYRRDQVLKELVLVESYGVGSLLIVNNMESDWLREDPVNNVFVCHKLINGVVL